MNEFKQYYIKLMNEMSFGEDRIDRATKKSIMDTLNNARHLRDMPPTDPEKLKLQVQTMQQNLRRSWDSIGDKRSYLKQDINKKFKELEHLLSTQHVDNNSESVRQLADSVVTLLTDIHQLLVG
jgi:uncharacterized protein YoxC